MSYANDIRIYSLTFKDADCNPLEVLSVAVDDKAFRPERESETTYRTSTGSLTGTRECEI